MHYRKCLHFDRSKLGCTDGRYAERQRVVEVHQIVSHPPMAASEAMPPRRALPLPRRRTPSSRKPAMQFSLGGSKGGISLFEKEISLPCPCSAIGAAIPHMVWGRHYSDNKIRSLSSSCPAPALKRAMRSSTLMPLRSSPATSSTMCPSAIISVRLPSSSA